MFDTQILMTLLILVVFSGIMMYLISAKFSKLKEELKSGEDTVLIQWLKDMKLTVDKNSDTLDKQLHNQRLAMN